MLTCIIFVRSSMTLEPPRQGSHVGHAEVCEQGLGRVGRQVTTFCLLDIGTKSGPNCGGSGCIHGDLSISSTQILSWPTVTTNKRRTPPASCNPLASNIHPALQPFSTRNMRFYLPLVFWVAQNRDLNSLLNSVFVWPLDCGPLRFSRTYLAVTIYAHLDPA